MQTTYNRTRRFLSSFKRIAEYHESSRKQRLITSFASSPFSASTIAHISSSIFFSDDCTRLSVGCFKPRPCSHDDTVPALFDLEVRVMHCQISLKAPSIGLQSPLRACAKACIVEVLEAFLLFLGYLCQKSQLSRRRI